VKTVDVGLCGGASIALETPNQDLSCRSDTICLDCDNFCMRVMYLHLYRSYGFVNDLCCSPPVTPLRSRTDAKEGWIQSWMISQNYHHQLPQHKLKDRARNPAPLRTLRSNSQSAPKIALWSPATGQACQECNY